MKYYNLLFTTCSLLALVGPSNLMARNLESTHTNLELKPINNLQNSFNLAATTFLPEYEENLQFDKGRENDISKNNVKCRTYPLSSCPENAKCKKCTYGSKYKITSCNTNYKLFGELCIAKSCSELNVAYKNDVPLNNICNIKTIAGKTCYNNCKNINFTNYPIETCPSEAICIAHPDCATNTTTQKAHCSPIKEKVIACKNSSKKVNSTNSACIDKDDTCPISFSKFCETEATGSPQYTEKGTACYQCSVETPKDDTCPINFSKFCETEAIGSPQYTEKGTACYQCSIETPKDDTCPTGYEEYGGFWTPLTTYPIDIIYIKDLSKDWEPFGQAQIKKVCIKQESIKNAPKTTMPILYSDMSTSTELIPGKTPIGVVFDIKNKKALALHYEFSTYSSGKLLNKDGSANNNNTCEKILVEAADYYTSGTLNNEAEWLEIYKKLYPGLTKIYEKTGVWDRWNILIDDNGEENTKTTLQLCKDKNKICPAHTYVNNYQTDGTSSGDWYLPAQQELMIIYYHAEEIRKAVEKAKGHHYVNFPVTYAGYESSSQETEYATITMGCSSIYPTDACLGFSSSICLTDNFSNSTYFPVINYGKK